MRKLSKKISMLMVLAMLVGMFSGIVSASAASAWSFKSKNYNVAVDGTVVMGNKEYADFDLLKDGKAPTGYTVKWASSNEDVVWVNAKTGQLRANKLGMANIGDKAVISATFTNTATKKSATRSFVIAYGTPEYELVTKIGDVVLGEETLAVGESYKLATTVLDVDGNSVDFKTCKLYRNYFVDGKAIANPYSPEKEGEFTIVVGAFTAKADMDDLSKAVQTEEYKVTATTGEFSAEATGLKEITVYGDFAKNSVFTIKKDGVVKIAATATIAEDGKSAKLALTNRLTKGVYTVASGESSVDITCEDEYPKTIIIVEKDGVVNTNTARTEAYAHYDVLNQYGESIRKTASITLTGSTNITPTADPKTGIVTIKTTSGNTFVYGTPIILNIAANGYAAFESATMSAGLENSVHAVNVKGVTLANSGKIYAEAPVSFLGAKGADSSSPETSFYLLYTLVDRSGYEMDFDPLQNANLTFTSFDPLLIQSLVPAGSKFIDGVEYGAVQVVPGLQLKKGGSATIRISSNKTGNGTDYELKVAGDQILKEFNILSPEDIIIKNKVDAGNTTVTLKYEAIDADGKNITDFRALYDRVSFSDPNVKLKEKNDGTAELTYTVDASIWPTKDYDMPVVITAIVPEGRGNNVTLRIKEARRANSIEGYHGVSSILEGTNLNITLGKHDGTERVSVYDQYDQIIQNKTDFYYGTAPQFNNPKRAVSIAAKILGTNPNLVISNGAAGSGATAGYKVFAPGATLTLAANDEVTENYEAFVVEFVLVDFNGDIISGSAKNHTFYVADISQAASFSVAPGDGLLENKVDDTTMSVKVTLNNGDTLNLANVAEGTAKYMIDFKSVAYVYEAATSVAMTASNVAGNAIDPEYMDEKLAQLTFGSASQFENPSVINPDGTYGKRNVTVNGTATIYVGALSGSAVVGKNVNTYGGYALKDIVKTTAQVGGYERQCEKVATKNVTNGKATISAADGVISYDKFMGFIDYVIDNYGDKKDKLKAGDYKVGTEVTITNVKEDLTNGLKYNNFKVNLNAQKAAGNMILGAEIGDTFTVTYTSFDGYANVVVEFTVGADDNAFINTGRPYTAVQWY